ncbi:hypothetical protein KPH14_012031 [Odynerus spinipes]|uniref:NADH dehydrogenase [ubiquinone] 1 alpha subcomplex assembly factor 2 n=1 Tax=Odynerus spinipes TaxID=1348599 RepID=A0AAD9RFN4_9HYME|nr:hypothetical protein KPH14_012031 [Odynerus spinipes]
MSGKQRGLFRMIFRDFLASITPSFTRRKLMGEDYFGTKYYEVPISATSRHKRPSRYFQSVNNDFEQEIPAEWEAWLRHRRKEPPTFEEIEASYKLAAIKKLKGAAIENVNKKKAACTKIETKIIVLTIDSDVCRNTICKTSYYYSIIYLHVFSPIISHIL